jgi:hypothetical protein
MIELLKQGRRYAAKLPKQVLEVAQARVGDMRRKKTQAHVRTSSLYHGQHGEGDFINLHLLPHPHSTLGSAYIVCTHCI